MEAALDHLGAGTLDGKTIAMQGAGNVACFMIETLLAKGVARIVTTDIDAERCQSVSDRFPRDRVTVRMTAPADTTLFGTPCDVFAPNALGGILEPRTIAKLQAAVVCGAANNQLLDETRDAADLAARGIVWVPDFLANRMGIVNCANEQYGSIDEDPAVTRHLGRDWEHAIYRTTRRVLERAASDGTTPLGAAGVIADGLAEEPHPIFGHRTRLIYDDLVAKGWHRGRS
jgi:glutamate dehydrogenase/leucine dehydrogenase